MALRVPDRVREVWGDEMVVELGPWLQEFVREHGVPRDEYRELLSRLDALAKDISLIKEEMSGSRAELTQMGAGLRAEMGQMRAEFSDGQAQLRIEFREALGALRLQMDAGFSRVNQQFDAMNERMLVQTRWLIGSLTILGTIISVLLAIAQFAP